jgi:hypothetical protein
MIATAIRRLIKILKSLGVIDSYQELTYQGEVFSLNQLYASGHWRTRQNLKVRFHDIFGKFIEENDLKFVDEFSIVIFYNTAHDVDNVTGMGKMFVDSLQEKGIVTKDDKRYYKLYCVVVDKKLPKNTLNIYLIKNGSKG